MFVHLRGEEAFIVSQTNPYPVKAFVLDARSRSLPATKAEFAMSEVEFTIDQYDQAPCHDYTSSNTEITDFHWFKECSEVAIR